MANSTRMRVSNAVEVFHRIGASGDMAVHDVGTTDTNVQGLGGSGDFELESDTTVDYVTNISQVVNTTEAAVGGDVAIADFIFIKNTGFTSADKDTAVAADAYITIGVGGTFANGGFSLFAGESICLHGLGGGSDNLSELQIDSSVAATYVEIVYL